MLPLVTLKHQEYLVSQSLREEELSVWKQVQPHSSHTVIPEEVGGKWFDISCSLVPCPSGVALCVGSQVGQSWLCFGGLVRVL